MSLTTPLKDQGIIVTRAENPHEGLGGLLEERGAHVLRWPAIRFEAPADPEPLCKALERLEQYDWLIISSPRVVEALGRKWAEMMQRSGRPPAVAAIGRATAQHLHQLGIEATLTAGGSGELLLEELAKKNPEGQRIFFPASSIHRSTLPEGLVALGASVDTVIAYRTLPAALDREECLNSFRSERPGAISFASPSAVNFLRHTLSPEAFDEILHQCAAFVIGKTTESALVDTGFRPAGIASPCTLQGMADTISNFFSPQGV